MQVKNVFKNFVSRESGTLVYNLLPSPPSVIIYITSAFSETGRAVNRL